MNQKEEKMIVSTSDLVIHTQQPKGKMVKVLFEPKTKLVDSLTYDITAWSLPYAHGLKAVASTTKVASSKSTIPQSTTNTIDTNAYAYISKWNSIDDATFLGALLQADITPRFSNQAFTIDKKVYAAGSLIILRNDNRSEDFDSKLVAIANTHKRRLQPVTTGFVDKGVDFGSYAVNPINKQRIAVLSGKETSSLSFGEVWHFFETQLQYPITTLNSDYFSKVNFSNYDVIIIPSGYYSKVLSKTILEKLVKWTQSGGTLLVIGEALNSFADHKSFALKKKKNRTKIEEPNLTPYADRERNNVKNFITGSIFNSTLDHTHPLAFGYDKEYFSLKLSGTSYELLQKGNNVGYFGNYTTNVSGFAGNDALKNVPKSLLFGEEKKGSGSIIYMVDNPLFRSFWENGKLFVANAVFLLNSDILKH